MKLAHVSIHFPAANKEAKDQIPLFDNPIGQKIWPKKDQDLGTM